MCLYIDKDIHGYKKPRARTAKEDIPVYKIIKKSNKSLHRGFKYTRRKDYEHEKLKHFLYDNDYIVEYGFHAYTSLERASEAWEGLLFWDRIDTKIVRFTIPAGAEYFMGEDGEVVSGKIRSGELRPLKWIA